MINKFVIVKKDKMLRNELNKKCKKMKKTIGEHFESVFRGTKVDQNTLYILITQKMHYV